MPYLAGAQKRDGQGKDLEVFAQKANFVHIFNRTDTKNKMFASSSLFVVILQGSKGEVLVFGSPFGKLRLKVLPERNASVLRPRYGGKHGSQGIPTVNSGRYSDSR